MRSRRQRAWLLVDLLIVAWLIWLFDAINNLAPVRQALAEGNGRRVLDLERSLHLDPEHALDTWLAGHHELSQVVVFWYENVHIVVTLAVFALLWWRRADALGVLRWTLVIVNLIALAVFWSFPVAPPRMLTGGYIDLVARAQGLPEWQLGATALHSNQLCSLPSLHIAWATWSSIGVWHLTQRRWLRALAVVVSVPDHVRSDGDRQPLPSRRARRGGADRAGVLRADPPRGAHAAGLEGCDGRRRRPGLSAPPALVRLRRCRRRARLAV